jgi:hypothetical protein
VKPLEKLGEHLEAAALAPMAGKLSFFDLTRALELVVSEYETSLPRRIMGSQITRREGERELAQLRRVYALVHEMDLLYRRESTLASARLAAATKPLG